MAILLSLLHAVKVATMPQNGVDSNLVVFRHLRPERSDQKLAKPFATLSLRFAHNVRGEAASASSGIFNNTITFPVPKIKSTQRAR